MKFYWLAKQSCSIHTHSTCASCATRGGATLQLPGAAALRKNSGSLATLDFHHICFIIIFLGGRPCRSFPRAPSCDFCMVACLFRCPVVHLSTGPATFVRLDLFVACLPLTIWFSWVLFYCCTGWSVIYVCCSIWPGSLYVEYLIHF